MEPLEIIITVTLLAVLAEVTYLVVKLPRQSFAKKQGRMVFVDTSVLIDGRIIAVAESNFIGDTLIIPRSVVGELQFLADNADHDKRARARHGLDVVKQLQQMPLVAVDILQDGSKAEEGVDERLLKLAKQYHGVICTIDYNLNKVAQVEGIVVLNVNELAQSLRMAYLPGEKMLLELVQKGQDAHQGVGYLTDGTMVVVEHANKLIGKTVEIEFIRSLQTAAGKMMFAKPIESQSADQQPQKKFSVSKIVAASSSVKNKKPAGRTPAAPVAVYHSDKNDSRIASKPQVAKKQPKRRGAESSQRNEIQQPRADRPVSQPRPKRPKTSAQREASLIDLVENQQ